MENRAPRKREQLEEAFRAFSQLSGQLEGSYRGLQQQVAELNRQLDKAQAERLAQAQQAARLAERLELLLATLPAGVAVLDVGGVIQTCNPAAERVLGGPVVGERWSAVAARAFEATCSPNGDSITRDGRRVTILSSASSEGAGRILLLTDVTERRALEALVNRNDRLSAMGRMAASLAHQIRTPLASALLYVSQCRRAALEPRYAQSLARGIDRLHDLERLVKDMLVFARGSGPGERVRVADLLRDVHAAVAGIGARAAALSIDGDHALSEIDGNRSALVAALTNLVCNALEAGPEVSVTLGAEIREGEIALVVEDDGPGIPAAIIERVAEPFFSTRPTGTGLGLAVAKTVAEAHGGQLALRSGTGSTGTAAELRLPLPSPSCPAGDQAAEPAMTRHVA